MSWPISWRAHFWRTGILKSRQSAQRFSQIYRPKVRGSGLDDVVPLRSGADRPHFEMAKTVESTKSVGAAKNVARFTVNKIQSKASVFRQNPILDDLPKYFSAVASTGLHVGAAGLLYWNETRSSKPSSNDGTPEELSRQPTIVSIGLLWEAIRNAYGDQLDNANYNDFTPTFKAQSRENLIAEVVNHLSNGAPIDYGDVFFRTEKILALDQRDAKDFFIMDFIYNRFKVLQKKVAELFGTDPINQEKDRGV